MAPIKRGDVVLVDLPLISRKLGALTEPVMREIEKRIKVRVQKTFA